LESYNRNELQIVLEQDRCQQYHGHIYSIYLYTSLARERSQSTNPPSGTLLEYIHSATNKHCLNKFKTLFYIHFNIP